MKKTSQTDGVAEQTEETEPSIWEQNRPLLIFAGGLALMAVTLLLWWGPLDAWHRSQIKHDLQAARQRADNDSPWEALALLKTIVPRIWRTPELAGEVYYLAGVANTELAERVPPGEGGAYRQAALPYLRAAQKRGVPGRYSLDLDLRLGQALSNVGAHTEAVSSLAQALEARRQLQAVIVRRLLQATLQQEPGDLQEARRLAVQWASIPDLARDEQQAARSIQQSLQDGAVEHVRETLADEERQWLPESANVMVTDIDGRAGVLLAIDEPEAAKEFLETQEKRNQAALSFLLKRLMDSSARQNPPDLDAALVYGDQRLALQGLSTDELDEGRLRQAELLLRVGRFVQARELLQQVPSDRPQASIARFLMGKSYFDQAHRTELAALDDWQISHPLLRSYTQLVNRVFRDVDSASDPRSLKQRDWQDVVGDWVRPARIKSLASRASYLRAREYLDQVMSDATIDDESYLGRSLLMLGVIDRALGQAEQSEQSFRRVIAGFPNSDFSRAARFLLADALWCAGDERAITELHRAVAASTSQQARQNPFLSQEELARIFREGWQAFEDVEKHQQAIELAKAYAKYSVAGQAFQMHADSAVQLAEEWMAKAAKQSPADAEALRQKARGYYREAGELYQKVADAVQSSQAYQDYLWQAGLSSFHGQAYERALVTLQEFAKAHGSGARDFLAHLYIARCHMSQRRYEEAREILEAALQRRPRAPNRFEGRIRLAQCYLELARAIGTDESGQPATAASESYAKAELYLRKNTDGLGLDLDPTASEWRESLFALGRLLLEVGRYDEAVTRLHEAVRRFPDDEQALDASYRIAEAYLRSAKQPAKLLDTEQTPLGRSLLQQEELRRLTLAIQHFSTLTDRLVALQGRRPLTSTEKTLLRDCYFNIGEASATSKNWPAAIEAYTTAAYRFQDQPDCLTAYVQIANACWQVGRDAEALSHLRQARYVLSQLDDAVFEGAPLSKQDWKSRLDSMVGDL